jgi:hypothetical protein
MNREELFASIAAACPDRDDTVYLERRGPEYDWRIVPPGGLPSSPGQPDVWMSFSAVWPSGDTARTRAFFDDLLAELESMADKADRCRWSLDEPWPHMH